MVLDRCSRFDTVYSDYGVSSIHSKVHEAYDALTVNILLDYISGDEIHTESLVLNQAPGDMLPYLRDF